MSQEPKHDRSSQEDRRPSRPGDRDVAHDQPAPADHSDRENGGDQDIDTAGMIPGNKKTDNTDPVGF